MTDTAADQTAQDEQPEPVALIDPCPCGNAKEYANCCEPLHDRDEQPATAADLMRSRYSAYVLQDADYLMWSWHPKTRPAEISGLDTQEWLGLEIVSKSKGSGLDATGSVEFAARFRSGDTEHVLRENSTFSRVSGRWVYMDGQVSSAPSALAAGPQVTTKPPFGDNA